MKNKEIPWSAHVCKCSTCEIQVAWLKWCRTVVQLYSNTIFRRRTFRLNVFEWTKKFKEFISTIYSCSSSSMCEQIRASHDVVHEANIHHPPAYTPTTCTNMLRSPCEVQLFQCKLGSIQLGWDQLVHLFVKPSGMEVFWSLTCCANVMSTSTTEETQRNIGHTRHADLNSIDIITTARSEWTFAAMFLCAHVSDC